MAGIDCARYTWEVPPPDRTPEILVLEVPVSTDSLRGLVESTFVDMVEYVVDVRLRIIAIGGQLHADAESILLDHGCRLRPRQGNRSMELQDPELREAIRRITFELVGRGEERW